MNRPWNAKTTRLLVIYVVWSVLWVLFSDHLLHYLLKLPAPLLWSEEMLKALIYVATTAIILGLVVREQHKESERERLSEQSKLRSIQAANLIGIMTWNNEQVIEANDAALNMLGYSRADLEAGRIVTTGIVAPEYYEQEKQARKELVETGRSRIFEAELICKDGSRVTVVGGRALIAGQPAMRIGYTLNITALKRAQDRHKQLEEELGRTRQLNALGQLTGGIAHDFNNLLGVIVGYTALLEADLPEGDPRRENTTEVLKAADKGRTLVRSLLRFSQKDVARPEFLDINEALTNLEKILSRVIGDSIQLRLALGERVGCAFIDSTQFEQIVMNLVVNARDAMPQGGLVTLTTGKGRISPGEEQLPELKPGDYIVIKVSDTGVGMDREVRGRIFEPFFTTRKQAGGTGLGLAIVYGAVKQNNGAIRVDSTPGRGTEFTVYLPWAAEHAQPAVPASVAASQGGSETVLLIEDDTEMRNMLTYILRGFGYTVIPASDGQQGVEAARQHGGKIHLVLTDIAMPRLSGPAAVEQIRRERPEIKALMMTGFAEPALLQGKPIEHAVLEKPITPEALARKIREVLGPGESRAA